MQVDHKRPGDAEFNSISQLVDDQARHYDAVFDIIREVLPKSEPAPVRGIRQKSRDIFLGIAARGEIRPKRIHIQDHSIKRQLLNLALRNAGNITNEVLCEADKIFFKKVMEYETNDSLIDKLLPAYLESLESGSLSERSRQIILRLIFVVVLTSPIGVKEEIYAIFKKHLNARYQKAGSTKNDSDFRTLEILEILTLSVRYPALIQLYYLVYQFGTPEFERLGIDESSSQYFLQLHERIKQITETHDLDGDAANPPSRGPALHSFFDIHDLSIFLRSLNIEPPGYYLNSGDGVISNSAGDLALHVGTLKTLSVSKTTLPRMLAFYLGVTDGSSMSREHLGSNNVLLDRLCDLVTGMFMDFFKMARTNYPPIQITRTYDHESQAWNAWDIICQLVGVINKNKPEFWNEILDKLIIADRENATGRQKGMMLQMQLDKLARLIITNAEDPTKAVDWYYGVYLSSLITEVVGHEVGGIGGQSSKLFETTHHLVTRVKKRDKNIGTLNEPPRSILTGKERWLHETYKLIGLYQELVQTFVRKLDNLSMLTSGFGDDFESLSPSVQQILLLKAAILEVESTSRFNELKIIYGICDNYKQVLQRLPKDTALSLSRQFSKLDPAIEKIKGSQAIFVNASLQLDDKLAASVSTTQNRNIVTNLRHALTIEDGS